MQRYILIGLFIFFTSSAQAAEEVSIQQVIETVCLEQSISKNLVQAIAEHESGLNPLAINIQGKGFYPKGKSEAQALIQEAMKSGASYDVGIMQINSYWIKRLQLNPVSLLEPEINVSLGVKILKNEIERHGFTWKAVGSYHSPNETRSNHYAWRIYNKTVKRNTTPEKVIARVTKSTESTNQIGLVVIRGNQTPEKVHIEGNNEQKEKRHSGLLHIGGSGTDHSTSDTRGLVYF